MLQIVAMQLQHEQIMHNLRNSNVVEIRRALHNQSVDLARQHQTEDDVAKVQATRDQALLELQDLELLHSQLHIKVSVAQTLLPAMCCLCTLCLSARWRHWSVLCIQISAGTARATARWVIGCISLCLSVSGFVQRTAASCLVRLLRSTRCHCLSVSRFLDVDRNIGWMSRQAF